MSNVVPITLPARTTKGKRGNITWAIIFDKVARTYKWEVTVPMEPQVFTGSSLSEAHAKAQVDAVIAKVTKKKV